jgi:hypothetical protein
MSLQWFVLVQMADNTVEYTGCSLPLPLFRGPRVRMGMHTGTAENVGIHHETKRPTYGGKVSGSPNRRPPPPPS